MLLLSYMYCDQGILVKDSLLSVALPVGYDDEGIVIPHQMSVHDLYKRPGHEFNLNFILSTTKFP